MDRTKIFAVGAALVVCAAGIGRATAAEDPAGYWATEEHDAQIKVAHCGDGICGTIFWMKDPSDPKGGLRLDKENKDEARRKRPLLGLPLLTMKAEEDHWKGTIYNAKDGKTYSATFKLLDHDQAEVQGCVAYVLCGGQKWTREEPKQASKASAPAQ